MFFMLAVFLIQYMLKARILIFLFGTEKYCIQRQVSPHKNKEVVFIRNTATSLDNSWLWQVWTKINHIPFLLTKMQ